MTKERLLVAEDNADMRDFLQEILEDAGYEAVSAADGSVALTHIEREEEIIDLLITDVRMPKLTGDQLLTVVRDKRPEMPVIVITAFGSVERAVEMVKAGAFQYLTKPFTADELLKVIGEALVHSEPHREQARLRRQIPEPPARIIGASRPMRELFEMIARAAPSMSTIVITGESGTGKELVAKALHQASERTGAFVPVNCGAIPAELIEAELFGHTGQAFTGAKKARAGLFEAAHGGTLFLDEIGDLPLAVQPKLLRALQDGQVRPVGSDHEREVDVRAIAATNRNLEEEMQEGRFREDLYWRLNVIQLQVPPLRERPMDIPLLVEHFLAKAAEAGGTPAIDVSPEVLALLTAYPWPGNVRELENVIERAVTLARGPRLTPADLPERVSSSRSAAAILARSSGQSLTLRELEREYIVETLKQTGGNKSKAAQMLGLDRKTLYRKLDEYRAENPETKTPARPAGAAE
jgi:DNA-binding NtrC family response regulator